MTCAACARTIERALQKVDGVSQASVNFATSRAAVRDVGYDVFVLLGRVLEAREERVMDSSQVLVTLGGAMAIAGVLVFFFGRR